MDDEEQPPAGMGLALQALWWMGRGDWDRAHDAAQAAAGPDGDWVHAHLHRVEGDLGNAAFWYRRAGKAVATGPFEAERAAIGEQLRVSRPRD